MVRRPREIHCWIRFRDPGPQPARTKLGAQRLELSWTTLKAKVVEAVGIEEKD